jgi:hypothetical protein
MKTNVIEPLPAPSWLASPHRVQMSRKAGTKLPPNTVVVSRPSKWGNPFKVTPERSQILAVGAFQTWLTVEGVTAGIADRKQWMLDNLPTLRGKNLACWCKPGTACHADVLLRLANDKDQMAASKKRGIENK